MSFLRELRSDLLYRITHTATDLCFNKKPGEREIPFQDESKRRGRPVLHSGRCEKGIVLTGSFRTFGRKGSHSHNRLFGINGRPNAYSFE